MSLAGRITEAWQRKSMWLLLLWPLSVLYALVTALRRALYRIGVLPTYDAGVPVIVVGNLTVGGTGKSPLVASLARQFKEAGFRPGVVSRGYGAEPALTEPALVSANGNPRQFGDEPVMLASLVSCPVMVCTRRDLAVRALQKQGCDVVIADDGLQHYRMARQVEICVVDGNRGWGNGLLLPAGPLREPLARLNRVSCLVVNGDSVPQKPADLPSFAMHLVPGALLPLSPDQEGREPIPPARIHAVAGIGHPPRFFSALSAMGFDVIEHAFADHHGFEAADFEFAEHLPVVMTAKDAVKCRDLALNDAWVLPVSAELDETFFTFIREQLKPAR